MKPLEIDKGEVLAKMVAFNEADSERASDAGESRQQIGDFLEKTGINNKAFSHCRMILRMKKDDKRQDWLRSMRALLPLMEEQIAAIGTKDAFEIPQAQPEAAQEADSDVSPITPADDAENAPQDAEIAAEAAEFDAAMAASNVTTLRAGAAV